MDKFPGNRLGNYEIVSPLGAGGMGEVYRGRDPRLKRDVAIKILNDEGLQDSKRRKRFEQEAQAVSALNHSNILVIFDIGSENGLPYMVTELVEGEPLRKLLGRGNIPTRRLLDLAVQIADGLAAAHQAKIVHRDLKPENILVTSDDRVKILDFGLAKLQPATGGENDETQSGPLTRSGMIQGTVPYMSPEQASGGKVDFRSDQFSFGSILYEMITGKRPFQRATPAQTLAAIISEEPESVSALNPRAPAPLRWLIDRCLAKQPAQRYDSTADLYRELRNLRDHVTETTSSEISPAAPVRSATSKRIAVTALMLLTAAVAGALIFAAVMAKHRPNFSNLRYTPIATDTVEETSPAWSPDGKALAFVVHKNGVPQVFIRTLTSPVSEQITQLPQGCGLPFWDPDGRRIYCVATPGLYVLNLAGGSPQRIFENVVRGAISPDGKTLALIRKHDKNWQLFISSPLGTDPRKYEHSPNGTITYDPLAKIGFTPDGSEIATWIQTRDGDNLWLLPYPSGTPRTIPTSKGTTQWFSFLPDGKRIVFGEAFYAEQHLSVMDLRNETIEPITAGYAEGESEPAVSPDGHRIAFTAVHGDSDIVEIPFDGSPVHNLIATSRTEQSPVSVIPSKQLLYAAERNGVNGIWLTSMEEGWSRPVVTSLDFGADKKFFFDSPSLSPDGKRVAYQVEADEIWISSLAGGRPVRLIPEEYNADGPTWSPDGNWIAFWTGTKQALEKIRIGEKSSPIVVKEGVSWCSPRWSPDGNWITCVTAQGLSLISPDGKNSRLLGTGQWGPTAWLSDSSVLYALQQTTEGHVVACSIDIKTSVLKQITDLGFTQEYYGLCLSPDGKSLITSINRAQDDIWILEGFDQASGFFDRFWR